MFGSKHEDVRFNEVRRVLALASAAAIGVVGSVSLLATSASAEDAAPAADETTTPASSSGNGSPAAPTTDPAATTEATPSSTEAASSGETVAAPDPSSTSPSASPSKAPQSNAKVAPKAVIEGDFGVGKVRVRVEAASGNYPASPDLSGATVEMRDITDPANPVIVGACTTDSSGICGFTESAFFFTSLEADHDYEVRQTGASMNFLADPEIVTFTASPDSCDGAGGCNSIVFEQVGAYRTVAVQKLSTVNGIPVAGATYVLCTPAPAFRVAAPRAAVDPIPGDPANGACPVGMIQAASATTDSGGRAYFSGVYPAGEGYAVFESTAAPGYKLDPNLRLFSLPAATTVAAVNKTVFVNVTDKPDVPAPVATNDAVSVTAGSSVIIRALDNDNGRGAPAFIAGFSPAQHGTVQYLADPTCAAAVVCPEVLVYTPAAGYTGTDTFLYTILTRGGSSTARVTITVIAAAAPVTESNGTALAYTGVDASGLVTSALGLIGAGSLLLAGGAIQRRRQLSGTHS